MQWLLIFFSFCVFEFWVVVCRWRPLDEQMSFIWMNRYVRFYLPCQTHKHKHTGTRLHMSLGQRHKFHGNDTYTLHTHTRTTANVPTSKQTKFNTSQTHTHTHAFSQSQFSLSLFYFSILFSCVIHFINTFRFRSFASSCWRFKIHYLAENFRAFLLSVLVLLRSFPLCYCFALCVIPFFVY